MTLVLGHLTNNPAEAIVLMNELEAGGFDPIMFDYHHGHIAIGNIMALGGFRIMLPEGQIECAREYIQARPEITDYDPIPKRKLIDIVRASVLFMNPFFPMYLLSPIILFLIWMTITAVAAIFTDYNVVFGILEDSLLLCVLAILAHARYVALPRKRSAHEP